MSVCSPWGSLSILTAYLFTCLGTSDVISYDLFLLVTVFYYTYVSFLLFYLKRYLLFELPIYLSIYLFHTLSSIKTSSHWYWRLNIKSLLICLTVSLSPSFLWRTIFKVLFSTFSFCVCLHPSLSLSLLLLLRLSQSISFFLSILSISLSLSSLSISLYLSTPHCLSLVFTFVTISLFLSLSLFLPLYRFVFTFVTICSLLSLLLSLQLCRSFFPSHSSLSLSLFVSCWVDTPAIQGIVNHDSSDGAKNRRNLS